MIGFGEHWQVLICFKFEEEPYFFGEFYFTRCKVFVENEFIRILEGALVIMEVGKIESLYVLLGNTIIGGAAVSSALYSILVLHNRGICEWVTCVGG